MERIAIFAALRWECRPVLRHMRQVTRARQGAFTVWHGRGAGQELWLIKTGIGCERAAAAARMLRETAPCDLFVSTGCAGALVPELAPGDLTVATQVIGNASGERFDTDPAWSARARRAAQTAGLRVAPPGAVLCSTDVLQTAAAKQAAFAATGAIAVDMESAAIAAGAQQAGARFAAVRTILDSAVTELPVGLIEPQTGLPQPTRVLRYLATHRGALTRLLALQPMLWAAQRTLDKFFHAL